MEPDELCHICAKIDLFSLFAGPRYYPRQTNEQSGAHSVLGTLEHVKRSTRCPLCRLVKYCLYGSVETPRYHPWDWISHGKEPDNAKVQCILLPRRSDYCEEMVYEYSDTNNLISTTAHILLRGTSNSSEEEASYISQGTHRFDGFQLLSPDSVNPARPLKNGHQITTTQNSLDLLSQWFQTCREKHEKTCHIKNLPSDGISDIATIQFIDVKNRSISTRSIAVTEYAALSYVWGDNNKAYMETVIKETQQPTGSRSMPIALPSDVPKVISDALHVCSLLSIPFLWVDLYCVHQHDPEKKTAEINSMGYIYRQAQITLIDGHMEGQGGSLEHGRGPPHIMSGLLPEDTTSNKNNVQRIETIGGQKFITILPRATFRIYYSHWSRRSWTYQEGALSRRVAFFNHFDIVYMCCAGTWCESQHNGKFGHDANIPHIDLRSKGDLVLASNKWIQEAKWDFAEYKTILLGYTGRDLSFESDKLNAILGCLNLIARSTGIRFIYGIPSVDFHYALLWTSEYDRLRNGFPSWSWAGWHSMQITCLRLYPYRVSSGMLACTKNPDILEYQAPPSQEIELGGTAINGLEAPHQTNRCLQRAASIQVNTMIGAIKIFSEIAHFTVDLITPKPSSKIHDQEDEDFLRSFDSSSTSQKESWDPDEEYYLNDRLILRNSAGYQYTKPSISKYRPWPQLEICLPRPLRGSTISWLLRDGLDMVKILDIEMLEGNAGGGPLPARRVSCLGIDRSQGSLRRFGIIHMTGKMWDDAKPTSAIVEIF